MKWGASRKGALVKHISFFLISFIFQTLSAQALDVSSYEGKTFEVLGPNCFATALKITGHVPTFRGVDGKEFELFTRLSCERVEQPQRGDIGIFAFPDGYAMDHAYVYLSPELGIEKQGVDYNGKTPIMVKTLSQIIYLHGASDFCRKYAPDPSVCSQDHYYVRCRGLDLTAWPQAQTLLDQQLLPLEKLMGEFVESKVFGSQELLLLKEIEKRKAMADLELQDVLDAPALVKEYLSERLKSIEGQIIFFRQKFP